MGVKTNSGVVPQVCGTFMCTEGNFGVQQKAYGIIMGAEANFWPKFWVLEANCTFLGTPPKKSGVLQQFLAQFLVQKQIQGFLSQDPVA